MDDLTNAIGSLSGGASAGGAGDIAGAIGGLLGGQGGLDGLLGQLSNAGLGNAVSSWVGTGPNQAVDPQQLGSALGPDTINQLSTKTGLDAATLLPMLASLLPTIINALTPDGKVPAGGAAGAIDIGSILAGLGGSPSAGSPDRSDGAIGDIGKILGGQ